MSHACVVVGLFLGLGRLVDGSIDREIGEVGG